MRYILFSAMVTACVASLNRHAEAAPDRAVPDFSLRDARGKTHTLADFRSSKLVVIAVLGTECPLAKIYAARLKDLQREYEPRGVAFLGLNANRQDSLAEIAAQVRLSELSYPMLKDPDGRVAQSLGAERTPEVFVLDADRVVRYRGRVDDQFGLSVQRPEPSRRDLAEALDELLAGKTVSVAQTKVVGCHIGREPPTAPRGDITYCNQIARVVNQRCVRCHRPGEIGPFPLTSYEDVASWAETIAETVAEERMPPWFASPEHGRFANDARLSPEEKKLFADWAANGCPEGDRTQLPTPPVFTTGWQIPEPDQVVYISDTPVSIQSEGEIRYQYFAVDPGFKEDKWIAAAEARPGNRAVVHHILVNFRPPVGSGERLISSGDGGLVGYAPGLPPASYPEGAALFVPAGSKIVFQMHYTPNGTPQEDRSYVGFKFADPKTVTQKIRGSQVSQHRFKIPPGSDNYEVRAEFTLPIDARLLTLTPHMHLRGKSFRYEAEYPDGRHAVLLDIPRWDFNWQLRYDLAEPVVLPKGSKLVCVAHYDNSEGNLSNPDPSKTVTWGDQTWDEMMIGYFTALPVAPSDDLPAARGRRRRS